ncbi:MAG: autotransporter-associated beta strand repeat-containing protein, partial [Chloroflexota bacterium]
GSLTLSGVNTYTGATTINGGVLALGASGTINNTSSISIAAGAGFDVSGKASGYTWSGSTTLSASGTGTDTATAAVIMGHADQTIAMGAQPITMNLAAGLSPGDTTHPALAASDLFFF